MRCQPWDWSGVHTWVQRIDRATNTFSRPASGILERDKKILWRLHPPSEWNQVPHAAHVRPAGQTMALVDLSDSKPICHVAKGLMSRKHWERKFSAWKGFRPSQSMSYLLIAYCFFTFRKTPDISLQAPQFSVWLMNMIIRTWSRNLIWKPNNAQFPVQKILMRNRG